MEGGSARVVGSSCRAVSAVGSRTGLLRTSSPDNSRGARWRSTSGTARRAGCLSMATCAARSARATSGTSCSSSSSFTPTPTVGVDSGNPPSRQSTGQSATGEPGSAQAAPRTSYRCGLSLEPGRRWPLSRRRRDRGRDLRAVIAGAACQARRWDASERWGALLGVRIRDVTPGWLRTDRRDECEYPQEVRLAFTSGATVTISAFEHGGMTDHITVFFDGSQP